MKKYFFNITATILSLFFSATTFAQDSNLKEDYTAFIPEIKFFNKIISQQEQPVTVLIKEGLEKYRSMMKSFVAKTILLPAQKNINGPGGNIRLVIFRPDTIRAVVLDIHGGAWSIGTPENNAALNDEWQEDVKWLL